MGKINIGKLMLSAVLFLVIAQIIHSLCAFLGMCYYMDPTYCQVWSKIMIPTPGPPPPSFMLYSILFNFIGGLLFSLVYVVIKSGVPGTSNIKKGLMYGLLIFLVAGIPGSLALILLINLPLCLISLWLVEGLIIDLLGGIIVVGINK